MCSARMENSVLYIGDAHDESLFTTLFTLRSAIIIWHNCSQNIITAWLEIFPTYVSTYSKYLSAMEWKQKYSHG